MTSEEEVFYRLKNPRIFENLDRYSVHVANVRREDHPDYVDAYIDEAFWVNGDLLSDADLDWINDNVDFVHEMTYEQVFM